MGNWNEARKLTIGQKALGVSQTEKGKELLNT